jgi:hypothetical protein
MTAIGPESWYEYEPLQRRFWDLLRQAFIRVLDTSTEPIDEYRASLSNASRDEQLLALHEDPLDVAAVLTGVTLTPEMISRYDTMLSEIYPDEDEVIDSPSSAIRQVAPAWGRGIPPYSVHVVLPHWIDRPPPSQGMEWRRLRRLPPVTSEISRFIPTAALTTLLERLGYSQNPRYEEPLTIWQLRSDRLQGLPEFVFVPPPTHLTADGKPAYDRRSLLNLYDWIIWLANRRSASPETLVMLVRERDQFARGLE